MTTADEVVATAKKLLAEGKADEAQNLLLDEGYVNRLEPVIQKAYLRLIPVGRTLRAMLDEVYTGLDDPDPKVRFAAITKIARAFNRELLRDNVRWMRDPRASEPIMNAVSDPDPKVSARALGALSRLVLRYFPDQRTLPIFLTKLEDKKQDTRTDAIGGISGLRCEELLRHLVGLLEHGSDKDRSDVSAQLWGGSIETEHHRNLRPIEWTDAGRRFWREKLTAALRDPYVNVRKHAARALKQLGDGSTARALELARAAELDEDTAYYMDDAIEGLQGRS